MRILVTTDDGAWNPGLELLLRAINHLKKRSGPLKFLAVASIDNHSGCGSGVSLLGRMSMFKSDGFVSLSSSATPVDCIKYGLQEFKPDWVIVGVNHGANIGRNILTSGTVCAAAYAAQGGIPAIAISQHLEPRRKGVEQYQSPERVCGVLKTLLSCRPIKGFFFNVNLPSPSRRYLGFQAVEEVGVGGYLSKIVETKGNLNFSLEWSPLSKPEKQLDAGWTVVQAFKPFETPYDSLVRGRLGDGSCAGHKENTQKSRRSCRSSAKRVDDAGVG